MTLIVVLTAAILAGVVFSMIHMPGASYRGALDPLTTDEAALRDDMARDVTALAGEIGERNVVRYDRLLAAAQFIEGQFNGTGLPVRRIGYEHEGRHCDNIEAELAGTTLAREIVVVGGHYDTVRGSPGANDNGSGVAATLALARRMAAKKLPRTVRFVAFVNEEAGAFKSEEMGSLVYARQCRERNENIVAMLSLETIGYYSSAAHSQVYPVPGLGSVYPTTGDFIAFVGNLGSRRLVREAVGSFRQNARFPCEGAALPSSIPGIDWSDHWSFWQAGYQACMVTDTAPFRYPYYHLAQDTPDKLDYERMARVVAGLQRVIEHLAGAE